MANAATREEAGREYLTFSLGGEEYAVNILQVQEIRAYERVTRIANMPAFIKGVMNLRGTVVPVVDLRVRFNVGSAEYGASTIVIVINIGARTIGMVVDGVSDVVSLKAADVRPAPQIAGVLAAEFLEGVAILDKRMLILVDIHGLMSSREMGLLESAAAA
ncbi:MAG TPA: chemotaxis protein CheW [Burkholderiales bacterium]|jgi:purine-binding chemotaxis protein CheW|nr:chemotaxis protein CheW [Burkholderiales bacterium]